MEIEKKAGLSGIFNPIWIIIALVIPQLILVCIYGRTFFLTFFNLDSREYTAYVVLLSVGSALVVGLFIYSMVLFFMKKEVPALFSGLLIGGYTALLYALGYNGRYIFGPYVPDVMINFEVLVLYTGTFVIPAYFYALLLLIAWIDRRQKSRGKKQRALLNFLAAVLIPGGFYFFYTLILVPFTRNSDFVFGKIGLHSIYFLIVVLSICFYFFIIRGIYLLFTGKSRGFFQRLRFLWIILFALVLPVLGLLLNEMYFPFSLLKKFTNIDDFHQVFGDFSNPAFLILAVVNGLFLSFDSIGKGVLRRIRHRVVYLFIFLFRVLLFPFSCYFLIVFMPFFPLSFVTVLLFGVGFLLIAPLVLFIFHFSILKEDFIFLSTLYKKPLLIVLMVCSVLIIPLFIPAKFAVEKYNLNNALSFTYYYDYTNPGKKPPVNRGLLASTLKGLKQFRDNRRPDFFEVKRVPYITPLFHGIVAGRLALSGQVIGTLEKVFFNDDDYYYPRRKQSFTLIGDVVLDELISTTRYDSMTGLYHTWIDLTMINRLESQGEYGAIFDLPAGSWIGDYYLDVNGERVKGALAEKKSVLWIYKLIRRRRRDPGILYYLDHNTLELRVFPFAGKQTRTTGFEIVHLEPMNFTFDNVEVACGRGEKMGRPLYSKASGGTFFSSKAKKNLPVLSRTPYYHFIVNCSEGGEEDKQAYIKLITEFLEQHPRYAAGGRISFTGNISTTYPLDPGFSEKLLKHSNEGAFLLERALKELHFNNYMTGNTSYPVPVVVNINKEDEVFESPLDDFHFAMPDSPYFYSLGSNRKLYRHLYSNYLSGAEGEEVAAITTGSVLKAEIEGNIYYLPDDGKASFVFDFHGTMKKETSGPELTVDRLFMVEYLTRKDVLYPAEGEKNWRDLYYFSKKMNILSKYTSFVVLETEAQMKMLLDKEKKVLNSKKYFDASNQMKSMSEPPVYIVVGLFCVLVFMFRRRMSRKRNR